MLVYVQSVNQTVSQFYALGCIELGLVVGRATQLHAESMGYSKSIRERTQNEILQTFSICFLEVASQHRDTQSPVYLNSSRTMTQYQCACLIAAFCNFMQTRLVCFVEALIIRRASFGVSIQNGVVDDKRVVLTGKGLYHRIKDCQHCILHGLYITVCMDINECTFETLLFLRQRHPFSVDCVDSVWTHESRSHETAVAL